MSHLDTHPPECQPKMGQYLHKYALLYTKCAKGLDSNVSPEEMHKELIRMAGYCLNYTKLCLPHCRISVKLYYRTGQVKHLEKALEICNRQSLDINDKLLLAFLKHSIQTVPARNLEEVLTRIEFNTLISNKKQFFEDLMLEVYDDVLGTNHNVLIAFYTVLNIIYPDNHGQCESNLTPVQHIKLLKRVHSTVPGNTIHILCYYNLLILNRY